MLSNELIAELHKLSQADKLRAVQILVNELAMEAEVTFESDIVYPIYTPYGNEAAAQVLLEVLKEARAKDGKTEEAE